MLVYTGYFNVTCFKIGLILHSVTFIVLAKIILITRVHIDKATIIYDCSLKTTYNFINLQRVK